MSTIEEDIEYINTLIVRMADKVIENLEEAFDIYLHFQRNQHYDPINDDLIDHMERMIEEECLNIMLRQRPFAHDLRKVSGVLKLVEDLERLGDHAEDIYEFAIRLRNIEHHEDKVIQEMIDYTMKMTRQAVDSFVKHDIELAKQTIAMDDKIDSLYEDEILALIERNKEQKCSSGFAIYTTLVVKYIERIADHAVNVAEWVVYIQNGYHKDKQIC